MSVITERGGRVSQEPQRSCAGRGPRPGECEPELTPILRLDSRSRERLDAALRAYANADRAFERATGTDGEEAAAAVAFAAQQRVIAVMLSLNIGDLREVLSRKEIDAILRQVVSC